MFLATAPGNLLTVLIAAPRLDPLGVTGDLNGRLVLAGSVKLPELAAELRSAHLAVPGLGQMRGLDLEARAPRPIDIARRVMTAREAAAVAALDDDARRRLVVRTFAIKEAVYKAIDPHLGRYVGFHEVALRDPRADAAIVEVPDAWGLEVEATCQAHGDHWLATARARRR